MESRRKLRELREAKHLSQGDIEKKTGLIRCCTSRVEHGHTVQSIGTLQKYARALEIPLYRFFTNDPSVKAPKLPAAKNGGASWGTVGRDRGELRLFAKALSLMDDRKRVLLLGVAQRMASRRKRKTR